LQKFFFGAKMATFAEKLKEWREKRGWTQSELADISEVPQRTISNLEQGRTTPMLATATLLAKALKLKLEELQDDEPPAREVE